MLCVGLHAVAGLPTPTLVRGVSRPRTTAAGSRPPMLCAGLPTPHQLLSCVGLPTPHGLRCCARVSRPRTSCIRRRGQETSPCRVCRPCTLRAEVRRPAPSARETARARRPPSAETCRRASRDRAIITGNTRAPTRRIRSPDSHRPQATDRCR